MTGPSSEQVATLIELKRWDDAVAAADRLLATNPDDGRAWCQRAVALIGAGRYDEALVAADRAAGILPAAEHPQRLPRCRLARHGQGEGSPRRRRAGGRAGA